MWLGAALLACLALLAALLVIPLRARFSVEADEALAARLRVEWLFGWVGADVALPSRRGEPARPRRRPSLEGLAPFWQEPFREALRGILRRARRFVTVDEIVGWARLGLSDPAETGIAIGMLQPVVLLFDSLPRVVLRLDPDFERPGVRGQLRGSLAAVPLGVLAALAVFALSPAVLRTFWRLRSRPS